MILSARLILWDIDHTLVEFHKLHYELYAEAFETRFGRAPMEVPEMAGRTDRESSVRILEINGISPSRENVSAFWAALVERMQDRQVDLPELGHPVDGAAATLQALAAEREFKQSVLTGNLRLLAEMKLAVFDLDVHLDLSIGGYGEDAANRTDLVSTAQKRFHAKHGRQVKTTDIVLIGDTPLDVKAAHGSGARIIAVATGKSTTSTLANAGADVVMDRLDPAAVISAIRDLA